MSTFACCAGVAAVSFASTPPPRKSSSPPPKQPLPTCSQSGTSVTCNTFLPSSAPGILVSKATPLSWNITNATMQGGSIGGGIGIMKAYVTISLNGWYYILAVQEGTDFKMVKVSSTPSHYIWLKKWACMLLISLLLRFRPEGQLETSNRRRVLCLHSCGQGNICSKCDAKAYPDKRDGAVGLGERVSCFNMCNLRRVGSPISSLLPIFYYFMNLPLSVTHRFLTSQVWHLVHQVHCLSTHVFSVGQQGNV